MYRLSPSTSTSAWGWQPNRSNEYLSNSSAHFQTQHGETAFHSTEWTTAPDHCQSYLPSSAQEVGSVAMNRYSLQVSSSPTTVVSNHLARQQPDLYRSGHGAMTAFSPSAHASIDLVNPIDQDHRRESWAHSRPTEEAQFNQHRPSLPSTSLHGFPSSRPMWTSHAPLPSFDKLLGGEYGLDDRSLVEQTHTSSSAGSSIGNRDASISPPVEGRDGTISPPTTVTSRSNSEDTKLGPLPINDDFSIATGNSIVSTSRANSKVTRTSSVVDAASAIDDAEAPKRSYPGAKRGRKPKPPPTPEEAQRIRDACLEKNRVAALHSRRRKKYKNGQLEDHAKELLLQNQQLQHFARDLHVELMQLRALLARLPTGFQDVNDYLTREVSGGGIPTIMSIAGPTLERDYTQHDL